MKKIILGIVTLVLIAVAFFFGFWLGDDGTNEVTLREEIANEIKERLIQGKIIEPEESEIFYLINPVLKERTNNYLIVNASIQQDPLGEIFPEEIKIAIDENTSLEKWIFKTEEELKKEYQTLGADELTPLPYHIEVTALENLKENVLVYLIESQDNIKREKEIIAKKISFSN